MTIPTVQNSLYSGNDQNLGVIHSQIRMKCNNLKAHHVVESPQCTCMGGIADANHDFFYCPCTSLRETSYPTMSRKYAMYL